MDAGPAARAPVGNGLMPTFEFEILATRAFRGSIEADDAKDAEDIIRADGTEEDYGFEFGTESLDDIQVYIHEAT